MTEHSANSATEDQTTFRPPAVPLVAHTPYFDIWSFADRLTDCETTHWTGAEMPLRSLVRVDGRVYRVMGAAPTDVAAMPQVCLQITPTRSIYAFSNGQVEVKIQFTTPALADDLALLSRPVTYVSWDVKSIGSAHSVQVYFDEGAQIAVDKPDQPVELSREAFDGIAVMRVGSQDQPVLEKSGDDLRIDWGYGYLALPAEQKPSVSVGPGELLHAEFVADGRLTSARDGTPAEPVNEHWPVMAVAWDLGQVSSSGAGCWAMLAYDELYSINYFGRHLRPYWTTAWPTCREMLQAAKDDYVSVVERCHKFDDELMADLIAAGGSAYERMCTLAYRQTFAANAICDDGTGRPLMFSKECFSNGCMATVDVNFPAAPQLLMFNPLLLRASILPALDYARMPQWKFSYAPHDVGRHPHALGQAYGGGEESEDEQMPVEESGNLLIMMAALQKIAPDAEFAREYLPLLKQWADYLIQNGLDPANQLCTSDMFGLLAHNADLSIKAVLGIGAYAYLACELGKEADSTCYRAAAEDYAAEWIAMAADSGRTRLAFDQPDTWGMKHNLIWDRVLGLGLFPNCIGDAEVDWYKQVQAPYGLPNDSRTTRSLVDWAVWSFSLAQDIDDWQALLGPIFRYFNETRDRVPMCDYYDTSNARRVGFQARPTVGGLYIKLMLERVLWKKWAGRAATLV